MSIAKKTNPALWERSVAKARAKMGGHSGRAMQLATKYYKSAGGKYSGKKPTAKNNSMKKWTKEDWKWSKKDKPGPGGSGVYLPSKKISGMKSTERGRAKLREAAAKKAAATRSGRQYSRHGLAAGTSLKRKKS